MRNILLLIIRILIFFQDIFHDISYIFAQKKFLVSYESTDKFEVTDKHMTLESYTTGLNTDPTNEIIMDNTFYNAADGIYTAYLNKKSSKKKLKSITFDYFKSFGFEIKKQTSSFLKLVYLKLQLLLSNRLVIVLKSF